MKSFNVNDKILSERHERSDTDRRGHGIWLFFTVMISVLFLTCHHSRTSPDGGEYIKFKGYMLYVKDRGAGDPAVIIENGLTCNTMLYDSLFQEISRYTRVLSYDHVGIGRSTCNGKPRTIDNFTRELKALLEIRHVAPPYILVGHSMGGFLIRYFAHLYPDQVAGLVFIDAPHEDWFAYMRSHHTPEDLQFFNDFFDPEKRKMKKPAKAELSYYSSLCDSVRGKLIPAQIPVRMYTGKKHGKWATTFGYTPDDLNVWAEMQGSILNGVNDAQQFIDSTASHMFHKDKQELVSDGIQELIQMYRIAARMADSGTAHKIADVGDDCY